MELWDAEEKAEACFLAVTTALGALGCHPVTEEEDCGSESGLTGQVSCTKGEAQPGFKPMSFHVTDHLPEDGMNGSRKVQVFLDEKVSRGDQPPLCACIQEHQEN